MSSVHCPTPCVNNYLDALSVSAFRLVESGVEVAGLVGVLVFSEVAGLGVVRLGVARLGVAWLGVTVAALLGVFADFLWTGAGVPEKNFFCQCLEY